MTDPHLPQRPELTVQAVLIAVVLAMTMGAANVYLGLRVGMTVSASIPAAVMAMAILNGVMRRQSILEANLVQTGASAGESLAAGIIFTIPALILVGVWESFHFWTTSLIALAGGLLGVLFMIPMRKVFVVENRELQFPEGIACAEVLKTGETSTDGVPRPTGAGLIFGGLAVGAVYKVLQSMLGLLRGSVDAAGVIGGRVFFVGCDLAPALLSVGLIVGLPISLQIFTGGAIGWLVAIPVLSAGSSAGGGESAVDVAWTLWSTQVRYMGVGAMVVGGIVSIWKVRSGLVVAGSEMLGHLRGASRDQNSDRDAECDPTNQNLSGRTIFWLTLFDVLLIAGIYYTLLEHSIGLTLLTTAIMLAMSFFFTAVASYIVGLVGNSNSPVSGMTITAVLGTGALLTVFGQLGLLSMQGYSAIVATLGVAGIVCCVACTAGDVCNDLKTGALVGASPRSQQIVQLVGVLAAAFVMAPVLTVLHEGSLAAGTGGIGGSDLPAPQAVLFAELAKGFFGDGQLPWDMVGWGVGLGVLIVVIDWYLAARQSEFRLHIMPVAVGIYLPFGLSVPILFGGLLQAWLTRQNPTDSTRTTDRGVLLASGLIAGESLMGVLLGVVAYLGWSTWNLGERLKMREAELNTISLLAFAGVALMVIVAAKKDSTH